MSTTELGDRRYDSGEGRIPGRVGVWVATRNEETQTTTVSWRMKDDKPIFEPSPLAGPTKFHALTQVESGVDWNDYAGPTGPAAFSEFDGLAL